MLKPLLESFNLTIDDLSKTELETLERWTTELEQKTLTLPGVREHINRMIVACERELCGYDKPEGFFSFASLLFRGRRNRHLKARLYNYVLLRDLIDSPERAREAVKAQLERIAISKIK